MNLKEKNKWLRKIAAGAVGLMLGISGINVYAEGQSPSPKTTATPKAAATPTPTATAAPVVLKDPGIAMYRLYNPNSGEHFYTSAWKEASNVIQAGWNFEGVGWFAPANGNDVYRLYNKNGGEHHYTTSVSERDHLVSVGWTYEGVGWKSGGNIPLHREYNPNAFANNHNYTTSDKENSNLVSLGWRDEGIAWYATGTSNDRMKGIDISQWNYNAGNHNNFDLTPYVGQFVIIRAGYGWADNPSQATADNYAQIDTKFKENVEKCRKLGIPYGFYWFSYATNADQAKKEADTFYAVTKNYSPAFGYWMDEEGDNWKNKQKPDYQNHDNITKIVNTFTSEMNGHGRKTGVYASYDWFNRYITTSSPKWVAHYGKTNNGTQQIDLSGDERHFVMHQYTSNPIDKDLLYVTYSDLFK